MLVKLNLSWNVRMSRCFQIRRRLCQIQWPVPSEQLSRSQVKYSRYHRWKNQSHLSGKQCSDEKAENVRQRGNGDRDSRLFVALPHPFLVCGAAVRVTPGGQHDEGVVQTDAQKEKDASQVDGLPWEAT